LYWLACCHHIVIDGLSIAICSAIVSGLPIPPVFFGSSQDFVDFELEYEASDGYLEDTSTHNILRAFDLAVVMRPRCVAGDATSRYITAVTSRKSFGTNPAARA
jgi:hypothetical protein